MLPFTPFKIDKVTILNTSRTKQTKNAGKTCVGTNILHHTPFPCQNYINIYIKTLKDQIYTTVSDLLREIKLYNTKRWPILRWQEYKFQYSKQTTHQPTYIYIHNNAWPYFTIQSIKCKNLILASFLYLYKLREK